MIWFEKDRIPPGNWIFLNTVRAGFAEIECTLEPNIDLTEGNEAITTTGCMRVYRQAVMRRALDLMQSIIASWNCGALTGAVVSSRSLLETVATFHAFLTRAQAAATVKDWEKIGRLVDSYGFSTSLGVWKKKIKVDEDPPAIGIIVKNFISAIEAGAEEFWNQICDTAHPNGQRMLSYAGILKDGHYIAKSTMENEQALFPAVYNAIHSCCWIIAADLDFDILLAVIRNGGELPADDPLIIQRDNLDKITATLTKNLDMKSFGLAETPTTTATDTDDSTIPH